MTLTEWIIAGSTASRDDLTRADPVKVAHKHGFSVEVVRGNLEWWRQKV